MIDTEKTGGRNPLLDMVSELSIDGSGKADEELERVRGPKVADNPDDDPRLRKGGYDAADPPVGSLESFMKLFGNGGTPGPQQR